MASESSALECQPLACIATCQLIVDNFFAVVDDGKSLADQKIWLQNLKLLLNKAASFVSVVNVSVDDPLLEAIE